LLKPKVLKASSMLLKSSPACCCFYYVKTKEALDQGLLKSVKKALLLIEDFNETKILASCTP